MICTWFSLPNKVLGTPEFLSITSEEVQNWALGKNCEERKFGYRVFIVLLFNFFFEMFSALLATPSPDAGVKVNEALRYYFIGVFTF